MEKEQKPKYVVEIKTKTIVEVILFGLLLVVLFQLSDLIMVVLTSIVVASFVEHIVKRTEKRSMPRVLTVVLVYIFFIGLLFIVFYFFAPLIIKEVSALIDVLNTAAPKSSFLKSLHLDTFTSTRDFVQSISGSTSTDLARSTQLVLGKISGGVADGVSFLFGSIVNLILIFVISFYLSIQDKGIETFLRIVTPAKYEAYIISLWQRTENKIGLWIQGQFLLGLIVAIMLFIGLSIIGVKYALLLSLIAGLSELIPYGILLAFIPAIGIAYAENSLQTAGWTMLLFIFVQQFEVYFLNPYVNKKIVGISPLVLILSLLIGAKLAGFWGVILAIPVSVCLLEYVSDVEKRKIAHAVDAPQS